MVHDELAQHLESLRREECYRVERVLKKAPLEETQLVRFVGGNGAESGPFIRKFMRTDAGFGSAYRRIFEAQQGGRRFKHLPRILECYERDGQLVVVMEYVQGQTLQDVVYERDPSLAFAGSAFPQLCDAVGELHDGFDPPIIHRDLKPSNVILTGDGLALIDFGISREYREGASSDTTHFGTREFAPPEQFGFGQTTVRSDIYSLGLVLYFCLTEEIPDTSAREKGFRAACIPETVSSVIARAAAFDPADRYASAGELKEAFLGAAAACPRENEPAQGAGDETRPWKKPLLIAACTLACLAIALVAALGLSAPEPAPEQSVQSADASPGGAGEPSSGAYTATAPAPAAEKPPRNGYDEQTNQVIEVAGVAFQLPRCFLAKTSEGKEGVRYYYAEHGSSVAMIMTKEETLDEPVDRDAIPADKDGYLSGLLASDAFDQVGEASDIDVAGRPARIVTMQGTTSGHPTTALVVYFYAPQGDAMGTVILGQTDNVRFDYSNDFYQVIASAR